MYLIKNAIQNIGRNKGRNLLLGVIIFAILLTSAVSILITSTTGEIIRDYKNRFGSEVFLNIDYQLWQEFGKGNDTDWITPEQQIAFSKSKYLKSSTLTAGLLYSPVDFETFDDMMMGGAIGSLGGSADDNSENSRAVSSGTVGTDPNARKSSLFTGVDNLLANENFVSGKRKIIAGKAYEKDGECVVSQQLAEKNNWEVGSTLTIQGLSGKSTMTLTIVGIFEDNTMLGNAMSIRNLNNEIIANFNTAKNAEMFQDGGYVDAKYYLKDPDDLDALTEDLRQMGLPKYYKAATDEFSYKQIVGPVEGLAKVTNTFLVVVLALGSVILVLLSTLAIRERKYEIGVLRAMGMKKGKVAIGLLTEMLVITVLCLALGLGVGAAVAQPVADSLLEEQVKIAEEGTQMGGGMVMLAPMGGNNAETLSEIDVHLSGEAVAQIALIALALTALSSVGGIVYITRFEPMKILSERG